MEETEVMIREDFASAIEDKKPLDEINTLHNNIRSNLDTAEKLFQQQQIIIRIFVILIIFYQYQDNIPFF